MSIENTKKSLGLRLNETRKKAGKTQQDFANEAGVSVVSWGDYERGNVSPNVDILGFLHKHKISVDYLLSGKKGDPSLTPEQELIVTQRTALGLATDKIATLNHELEGLRREMGKGKN